MPQKRIGDQIQQKKGGNHVAQAPAVGGGGDAAGAENGPELMQGFIGLGEMDVQLRPMELLDLPQGKHHGDGVIYRGKILADFTGHIFMK